MAAPTPPDTTKDSADPRVSEARAALAEGDFGRASHLLHDLPGEEAGILRARLRPDPWIAALIAACLLLFTFIVWKTLRHPHP